jgi:hypothetical protein
MSERPGFLAQARRRRHIAMIMRLLADVDLTPEDVAGPTWRDALHRRLPLPENADRKAYARWRARENRRQAIIFRMSGFDLLPQDLMRKDDGNGGESRA